MATMKVAKSRWTRYWNPVEGKYEYGDMVTAIVDEQSIAGVTFNGMPVFPSATDLIEPYFSCDHDEYAFWGGYHDIEPSWLRHQRIQEELAELPRLVCNVPNRLEWNEVW